MKTFLLALLSVTAAFSFQVVPTRRVIAIDMKIMKVPQSEIDDQGIEECVVNAEGAAEQAACYEQGISGLNVAPTSGAAPFPNLPNLGSTGIKAAWDPEECIVDAENAEEIAACKE